MVMFTVKWSLAASPLISAYPVPSRHHSLVHASNRTHIALAQIGMQALTKYTPPTPNGKKPYLHVKSPNMYLPRTHLHTNSYTLAPTDTTSVVNVRIRLHFHIRYAHPHLSVLFEHTFPSLQYSLASIQSQLQHHDAQSPLHAHPRLHANLISCL